MPTNRKVIDFKIHNLTEEQFQELKEAGQIDPNAIYCTPDETVANFEAVNARIDETIIDINTSIGNVDKKVDNAIKTEQENNTTVNARIDALEQTAGITSEQLNNKADVSDVAELQNNKLDKSAEIYLVPTGAVSAFAGTTPPTGWLKCDGSAISRTTYAALFAVIGTTYGTGDGSTTFNLPTQSVLPLGTSAQVTVYGTSKSIQVTDGTNNASLAAGMALGTGNRVGVGTKIEGLNKGDQGSGLAALKNDTTIGLKTSTAYGDSGIVGTADIANATGAKAIVCIKY